ncbi:FtsX-like permease family protein, partial [Candidatus Peregrinibacteria bacterium]|nr:FtsX-like permease family protein [Candidatus Peregrinibacteria bacterium]
YIEKLIKEGRYSSLLENIAEQGASASVMEKVMENLASLASSTKHVIGWLIAAFIIGGALIINSAILITIHSRRTEINIMRLVGAKPIFIRLPFIFEAIWYGAAATIIGFLITSILLWCNFLGGWAYFNESGIGVGVIFILELLCAIAVAVLSSMWSVHRNIKKHFLR